MRWIASTGLVWLGIVACGPPSTYDPVDPTGGVGGAAGSVTGSAGATGATAGTGGSAGGFGFFTEPVVVADPAPPPTSGGTLLTIGQGHKAAVADPENDQVLIVDLDGPAVTGVVALQKGDEPGRLVEDGTGRVHVALRSGGALVTIDPVSVSVVARQTVCTYPRGLAYDARNDSIYVACAGGELLTLPAGGGAATRELKLERDLRDVVIDGDRLLVSRFRTAELLVVQADGIVSARIRPASISMPSFDGGTATFAPAVAWRTIRAPGGGALMAYQQEQTSPISIQQPGSYGGGSRCGGGIVRGAVSWMKSEGEVWSSGDVAAVLPVDLAVSVDGTQATVVSAAASVGATGAFVGPGLAPFVEVPVGGSLPISTNDAGAIRSSDPCSGGTIPVAAEQVVAVSLDAAGRRILQTRGPSALIIDQEVLYLPGRNTADTGRKIFHLATFSRIACASCHPEGREDGHVWTFNGLGARRTQTVGGGILGTEPFHWNGELKDFNMLASDIFSGRMSGPELQPAHVQALANWINNIPPWKPFPSADAATVDRGRTVFTAPGLGCATCHAGTRMTNNATVNVGTGEAFQVPSLYGVGWRAPFMHNGCAATLEERFGSCGGGEAHGHISSLTDAQRADLIAYLNSL